MLKYIKQKLKDRFDLKTYNVGILQDQVYRILKKQTNVILKDYDLTSFEWAVLGILFESKEGENAVDLAEEIGVTQAFVSKVLKKLKVNKYIELKREEDGRYKKIHLSNYGRESVLQIEPILKEKMKVLLKDIVITDLYGYVNTLKKILENSGNIGYKIT